MANLPEQIGKYDIIRRLGHGGMGTVYLGRDRDLDRMVAIKVLRDAVLDEELLQRFLREARSAANLRHENIITVYDVGQHDHQPYMAMEFVDGTALSDVIRQRQPLTLSEKLSYIEQICAGLFHAHAQGIVHRDIKPANLMLDGRSVIRILDFGIARTQGSGMTSDGALIGTLSYMSPEQMLGRPIDHRSDIFAVGAVAYELLCYQQAFPGSIQDGLLQRLPNEDPPSLPGLCPDLPPALEAIVMRALAKQPDQRFAGLDEFRTAVREVRRTLDPALMLEPITILDSKRGAKNTPTPSGAKERGELLERRARQIATHRDAARAALAQLDLDSAMAACEDALTLDPDDAEALRILGDIQQTRQRHEFDTKERRERERTVRQRLADAELRLSKADPAGAARLLQQALTLNPDDPAALTLVTRVKEAAAAARIDLPELTATIEATKLVVRKPAAGSDSGRPAEAFPPTMVPASATASSTGGTDSRRTLIAAAAVVLIAGVAGGIYLLSDRTPETAPTSVSQPATAPPAAATPSDNVAATPPPTPVPAAPPPDTAPPSADMADQMARVNAAFAGGDLVGALRLIESVLATTDDERTRALARRIAQTGLERMAAAEVDATAQKAADLAKVTFTAAAQAGTQAERAFGRSDYVVAGRRALVATDTYRRAEREATDAAARAAAATPTPTVPASPPPTTTAAAAPAASPPVPVTPPPTPAAAPAATATTAAAAPPSRLEIERPGILRALNRYQDAYREMSVKDLRTIYPSLARETGQKLERAFKECRAFDVAFLNPQVAAGEDPTSATVNTRSTYMCQPKSGQGQQPAAVQEVFLLRKVGDEWLIDSAVMMDAARRR